MSPSNSLLAETNWIIDVALGRDRGAQRILDLATAGTVSLFVPGICLSESVKHLEDIQRSWRNLAQRLTEYGGDISRASRLSVQRTAADEILIDLDGLATQAETRLWSTLELVVESSSVLDVDASVLATTRTIRTLLDLSPADSVVLATLVEAAMHDRCHSFLSKDRKAFDTADVHEFLSEKGITYFASPADFLRSIRTG